MKRFTKHEIVEAMQSHIVDQQIFYQNGVSIWIEFEMSGTVRFVVYYGTNGKSICKTLDEAAEIAAEQQTTMHREGV